MPRFETIVELPEMIQGFFEALTGQAEISPSLGSRVRLYFEAEDLWEVAQMVEELKQAAMSIDSSFAIEVPKPVLIREPRG